MLSMEVDVVQHDCPYIDTTVDHDVAFVTKQWDLNTADEVLETRTLALGATAEALSHALSALQDHPHMERVELLRREGSEALVRSHMAETRAMRAIRSNRGYITGPFEIRDGSEVWRIGFDSDEREQAALSDLDKHNDFSVESRDSLELEDYYEVLDHIGVAEAILDQCRALSAVERRTLKRAVEEGYFTRPREADLSTLAEEFGVSETAVSKNLRRSQRKVLDGIVDAIEAVEGGDEGIESRTTGRR